MKPIDLPESLSLDRRIERYKARASFGLYRWDLEFVLTTLSVAVNDGNPLFVSPKGKIALKSF